MKRVAVIGFGFIGRIHVMNILKNKELELAAIVDRDIDRIVNALHEDTGNFSVGEIRYEDIKGISTYSDYDSCLEKEKPDAVHICVHTNLHYEFTKKALLKGLHVLVEKPFVLNVEEGEELIRLARERSLMLMVAHVVRFMPPYQKLKKWVDDGTYGKLKFLSLFRFSGVPQWGEWKEKQKDFGSSGGALFDLVIHDIDFAKFLTGKEPVEIEESKLPGYLSKHDYINSVWKFDDDMTVKIEGGNIFHAAFPFMSGFLAGFDDVSITYSTFRSDMIVVADNEKVEEIPAGDMGDGYFNEIAYFYDCIEKGEEPLLCTPQSSLETIKLCYRHV
jgi:predicted dehydrogenase